jgi:hypothetical protein
MASGQANRHLNAEWMGSTDQANGHRNTNRETAGSEPGTICFHRLRQEPDTSLSVIQTIYRTGLQPAS